MTEELKQKFIQFIKSFNGLSDDEKQEALTALDARDISDDTENSPHDPGTEARICLAVARLAEYASKKNPEIVKSKDVKSIFRQLQTDLNLPKPNEPVELKSQPKSGFKRSK